MCLVKVYVYIYKDLFFMNINIRSGVSSFCAAQQWVFALEIMAFITKA